MSPTRAAFASPAEVAIEKAGLAGTIEATIGPVDTHFLGRAHERLTAGAVRLGNAGAGKPVQQPTRNPTALRANDLIGELREISGQVNRMMEQVERAIDRLAVHAG